MTDRQDTYTGVGRHGADHPHKSSLCTCSPSAPGRRTRHTNIVEEAAEGGSADAVKPQHVQNHCCDGFGVPTSTSGWQHTTYSTNSQRFRSSAHAHGRMRAPRTASGSATAVPMPSRRSRSSGYDARALTCTSVQQRVATDSVNSRSPEQHANFLTRVGARMRAPCMASGSAGQSRRRCAVAIPETTASAS